MQAQSAASRSHPFPAWLVQRILTGLVFLCVLVLAIHQIVAYDVWWQLKTGEWILEHGIPRVDPFSYAFPGRNWIEPRWLYCVLIHLVFKHLGLNWLIVGKAGLLLLVFWLLGRSAGRAPRWAVLSGLVLALAPGHDRFMLRPELASFLGLVLTLLCLQRYKSGHGTRWIGALPVVQLVWSNTHTLWVLGPVTQWIFLAGEWVQSRLARRWPAAFGRSDVLEGRRWWKLCAVAGISSVVPLANPYLLEGLKFPLLLFAQIGSGNYLREGINELNGPLSKTFFKLDYRTVVYLTVIGLSLGGFLANVRRTAVSRLALWIGFLVLSLKAQRNVALFGYVAAWATMLNVGEHAERPRAGTGGTLLPRVALGLAAAYCAVMIPLVATDYFYRESRASERFGFGLSDRRYPVRAMEFIRQNDLPRPVMHDLADGGYILFESGEKSVYVDGRNEIYGEEILTRASHMLASGQGLTDEARRLGVGTILVPYERTNMRAALEAAPDWALVYFDDLHLVYARISPQTQQRVERLAIDWRSPIERQVDVPADLKAEDWLEGWWPRVQDGFRDGRLGVVLAGAGNYGKALPHFERALEQDPGDVRACLYAGLIYEALGRKTESDRLLARVPRAILAGADASLLAGAIHVWAGRPEAAIEDYQRAIAAGGFAPAYAWKLFQVALRAGRHDLAESTLRRLIEQDPRSVQGWNALAQLMLQQGRREEAAQCLRNSLSIKPDQTETRRRLETMSE